MIRRTAILTLVAFAAALSLVGCASDEQNPISPQQMNDMRAKENASRQGATTPAPPAR